MSKKEISAKVELPKPAGKKEWTEKELKKYFDSMAKYLDKLVSRICNHMGDNNVSIDFLLDNLDYEPLVYALSSDIEGRKFFKWALAENIKKNQALINKIKEIEKKYNLPLEHAD